MKFLPETEIIPFHVSPLQGERVLILSPHPDDETLGCGGTVRLLVEAGKVVRVVFLTSGDKADPENPAAQTAHEKKHITDYSLMREKEADKALRILGVSEYMFLRFPDRGLFDNYSDVITRIKGLLLQNLDKPSASNCSLEFDTIYCPSPLELNPDHRVAARAVLELQKQHNFRIVFYEVAAPIRPNIFVDITKVFKIKCKAIRAYNSQLKIIDYLSVNNSLNKFRSLTLDKKVQYAEAFLVLENASEQGMLDDGWFNYKKPLV
ncbi:MAG: PIG-L deacetylase family protein [Nitrospirota bacterium]